MSNVTTMIHASTTRIEPSIYFEAFPGVIYQGLTG